MGQNVKYDNWFIAKGGRLAGRTHEEWLVEYTKFLFGPFPYHAKGQPLFAHGNIEPGTGCRKQVNLIDGPDTSVTVYRNDPIILEVIGVNYIIGDNDRQGNIIQTESQIGSAFDFEEKMHSIGKAGFKEIGDTSYENVSHKVVSPVRTPVFQFEASQYNPYLSRWDIPMPVGAHVGAMSSQLLLFSIPEMGEYLLKFEASSFFDYESCGIYQINVINEQEVPRDVKPGDKLVMKNRYSDIEAKIGSTRNNKTFLKAVF